MDDGSCIFTQTICDCAGTEINIEVLTWLGDGFADDGAFQWNDGPFVDFNCETWGYDWGDISGAPSTTRGMSAAATCHPTMAVKSLATV